MESIPGFNSLIHYPAFHPDLFVDGRLNLVGQIMHLASKEVQRLAGPVTVNQSKQQQHLFYGVINTQATRTAGTPTYIQPGTLTDE